jgi:hypothetical protein
MGFSPEYCWDLQFVQRLGPDTNLLAGTICDDVFVQKLPAVIRIDSQDRKREQRASALQACEHSTILM